MLIKHLTDCEEFIAGDSTILREILNPDKADLSLRFSLAHAMLKPSTTSYPHSLKSSEVYFILEGEGKMHINDETALVRAGDTIYISPHARQFIENIGATDLKFLCIVDPAWQEEDEKIF